MIKLFKKHRYFQIKLTETDVKALQAKQNE